MSRTTFNSVVRSKGGRDAASPGVVPVVLKGSFDPTAEAAVAISMGDGRPMIAPIGAIPLWTRSLGGATGGTNPTVDVGDGSTDDLFANELDADGVATQDAADSTELTADTTIYGMVGDSAGTGGTTTVLFAYLPADNGGDHN